MSEEKTFERGFFEKDPEGFHAVFGEEPILTPEQQTLFEAIKEHETEMRRRPAGRERSEYHDQRMFEIMESHYLDNLERHVALEGDAERIKQKWEVRQSKPEELTRASVEIQRAELQYESMSIDALTAEATEAIQNGGPKWTPDRILVLNRHLKRAGIDEIIIGEPTNTKPFLDFIKEHHRDEPWRYDSPETFKALDLYSTEFGQTKGLDGNHGMIEKLDIQKLYNGPK